MTKAKLPLKTKIAAWWLMFFGLFGTITAIVIPQVLTHTSDQSEWGYISLVLALITIVIGFLYVLPGILLQIKNKTAWISTIALLLIELAIFSYLYATSFNFISSPPPSPYPYTPIFFIYIIPLILVILDRKNYFKMVRQRALEKKDDQNQSPHQD
jgi:glucan phosphoethanolaminetransferase (alkaline phosphatase superfamily)